MIHPGSCHCGAITFEVTGPLPAPDACHCTDCRKFSGHFFVSTDVKRTALTVSGDEVHLDFTGTDPQVASALNIASWGVTHPFICQAINAYIVTQDPDIPGDRGSQLLKALQL